MLVMGLGDWEGKKVFDPVQALLVTIVQTCMDGCVGRGWGIGDVPHQVRNQLNCLGWQVVACKGSSQLSNSNWKAKKVFIKKSGHFITL